MIEADLRTYLLSQSAISDLIGERCYPLRLPQGVTLPAVTYQVVFGEASHSHDGASDLERHRIQIDCWAHRYEDAIAVASAVKTALVGYLGAMGATPYTASRSVNELDISASEPALWRRMVETSLWHQVAA